MMNQTLRRQNKEMRKRQRASKASARRYANGKKKVDTVIQNMLHGRLTERVRKGWLIRILDRLNDKEEVHDNRTEAAAERRSEIRDGDQQPVGPNQGTGIAGQGSQERTGSGAIVPAGDE